MPYFAIDTSRHYCRQITGWLLFSPDFAAFAAIPPDISASMPLLPHYAIAFADISPLSCHSH
jgi:hypothetical protein